MATEATITGTHFDALPYEEGRCWELIEGELVEASGPTPEHQILVQRLLLALVLYAEQFGNALVLADVEFALAANIRVRPDVCVLLGDRAKHLDRKVPVPGSPDLAIEVISPSERTSNSMNKVDVYLRHDVKEVWQIYTKSRQVVLYTHGSNVRKFSIGEVTKALLPGFELTIDTLFRDL